MDPLCPPQRLPSLAFFPVRDGTYQGLLQRLQRTVRLFYFGNALAPTHDHLREILAARYGGHPLDYDISKRSERDELVTLPPWLPSQRVVADNSLWVGLHAINSHLCSPLLGLHAINPHLCSPLLGLTRIPVKIMVAITVSNFPLLLWDLKYFQQFSSLFGELLQVHPDNLSGKDKFLLNLMIATTSLDAIPIFVRVVDGFGWIDCHIQILSSGPLDEQHPSPDEDSAPSKRLRPDPIGTPSNSWDPIGSPGSSQNSDDHWGVPSSWICSIPLTR